MNKNQNLPVNFDDYADSYEHLLENQLAFFSKDRGYFSAYKVDIAARFCDKNIMHILDFGCGIGLSLPYLAARFSKAKLYATDLSKKSLEYVRNHHPQITVVGNGDLQGGMFDLIFVAGVFHHVPKVMRRGVMQRLASLLADGGKICVFEHNPYNPITRRMVATCPFDADADLLRARTMKALIKDAGMQINQAGYCLFFPQFLKSLRPVEKFISWVPLGGQYFVVAEKINRR